MPLRFTLRQLEYFVAVGEEGSIARASRKLNVSSPAISSSVTQLEDEFGVPIFIRKHAQGLILTDTGRQLMQQAQRALAEAEGMNRLVNKISGKVQGTLKVACLMTFAQVLVPKLRRQFEDAFPLVQVSQFELDQTEIFEGLREAKFDLALTYDLDIPPDLVFWPLYELPPYAMMAEGHPLSGQACVTINELRAHPMVLLNLPHSVDYFLSCFSAPGAKPPQVVERTRDMAVMRSLVANGFGFSIANLRPLNDLSPDGQLLKFVPISGDVPSLQMGIAMMSGADQILTVKKFIEHCKAYIDASDIFGAP